MLIIHSITRYVKRNIGRDGPVCPPLPVKIRKRPLPEKRLSISRNLCYNLHMNENAMTLSRLPPPLLAWYRENARDLPWRRTRDPYRIWVSEIMLQQTRVAAVLGYYARFLAAFPTAEALAAAPEEHLMKLWEGLGYYSRARNLQKAARLVADRGGFPDTCEELLTLPGIGDYTAAAIASAAFARREAAVDGNVLRVITRLTDDHSDIAAPQTKKNIRAQVREIFPEEAEDIRIFNQALMELGATVCVPNGPPKCLLCPVRDLCLGRERGTAENLPVKAPKKARRVEEKTVFLLLRNGRAALRKRPETGLLAGLWEFPNVENTLAETAAGEAVRAWGLEPGAWKHRLTAKHIISHVERRMTGYVLEVSGEGPEDFTWVDTLEHYAVPSAFSRFTEEVRRELEK